MPRPWTSTPPEAAAVRRPGMLRDGLRLAVGTLTVLPVGAPTRVDRPAAKVAMGLGWLAAVPLGVVAGLLAWAGARLGAPPLLTAVVALAAVARLSRGLHLDGLADTADGLAASYDRERALDVMRTGDVGPVGVATLVLVLLGQAAAVGALVDRPWTVAGVLVASRAMLAVACARRIPAARPEGLGAAVAGAVPWSVTGLALVAVTLVVAAAAALDGLPVWAAPVAVLAAALLTVGLVVRCVRRLGGITGDVLGACVELSLLAALVVLVLV